MGKTQQLATTDEKLAESKENLEDTKSSLSADEEFLMMLKEKCSMSDSEWEERQKTRQLEMEACSKALAVLSSDDAHDLFTKTFNPALVQVESQVRSERRTKAAFVQKQEPAGPPPPPGFKEYKKNAAAGGVMGMIQQIINDAK